MGKRFAKRYRVGAGPGGTEARVLPLLKKTVVPLGATVFFCSGERQGENRRPSVSAAPKREEAQGRSPAALRVLPGRFSNAEPVTEGSRATGGRAIKTIEVRQGFDGFFCKEKDSNLGRAHRESMCGVRRLRQEPEDKSPA